MWKMLLHLHVNQNPMMMMMMDGVDDDDDDDLKIQTCAPLNPLSANHNCSRRQILRHLF